MAYKILAKSDKFGLKVKVEADGTERWFLIVPDLFNKLSKGDTIVNVVSSGKGKFETIISAEVKKTNARTSQTSP